MVPVNNGCSGKLLSHFMCFFNNFSVDLVGIRVLKKIVPNYRVCRTTKKKVNFVFCIRLDPRKGQCLSSLVL